MIELTVAIPVLLIFVFVSIEFSRMSNLGHQLTSVSRELGSAVFRDCTKATNDPDTLSCVEEIMVKYAPRIESLYDDIVLIVSIYRWSSTPLASPPHAPPPPYHSYQSAIVANGGSAAERAANKAKSKVSAATFIPDDGNPPPSDSLASLLKGHEVLVHSEVYYRYKPLDSTVQGIFGFQSKEFYVDTIF